MRVHMHLCVDPYDFPTVAITLSTSPVSCFLHGHTQVWTHKHKSTGLRLARGRLLRVQCVSHTQTHTHVQGSGSLVDGCYECDECDEASSLGSGCLAELPAPPLLFELNVPNVAALHALVADIWNRDESVDEGATAEGFSSKGGGGGGGRKGGEKWGKEGLGGEGIAGMCDLDDLLLLAGMHIEAGGGPTAATIS